MFLQKKKKAMSNSPNYQKDLITPGRQYISTVNVWVTDEVSTLQPSKFHLLSDALLTTKKHGELGVPPNGGDKEEDNTDFYSFIPLEDVQTIEEDADHPTTVRITLSAESRKLITVKFTSVHKKKVSRSVVAFLALQTLHCAGLVGIFCGRHQFVPGQRRVA